MLTFLISLLTLATLLYLAQTLIIYLGTRKLDYPKSDELPKISVLVALRNEQDSLAACVRSLLALDYPREKLEILLINDRSNDGTGELIDALAGAHETVRAAHIKTGLPGLSGKANAIAQGITRARHELILVTDGDCEAPAAWARAHASYYTDGVGLVGGFTLLDRKNDATSVFGKIQSLDWAYLLSIGAGAMGFGRPLSVLGNNFSFRKAAYEQVGGYRRMGFTIIEDFALMKTLVEKTRWKVRYPIDPRMLVYSLPMPSFGRFFHQRKRWSAGGKEVGGYGKFLMAVSWLVHLLSCVALLLWPTPAVLAAPAAVALADWFLLFRATGLVARRDLLWFFPLWEIFYFAYTSFFAPVLLFPTTVIWKDISYSWRFNFKIKRMTE